MRSEVMICNTALARIGVTMAITSLAERSKEAMQCTLFYAEVRDRVLGAAPWPFARKMAALQLTGTPPSKWTYRYQVPNDCLRIREVYPSGWTGPVDNCLGRMPSMRVAYELASGDDNNLVLDTHQEQAVIEYTARVTNPAQFDAAFASAFAWALAAEIALPLAKGVEYARNAAAAYEKEINEALARALNEEPADLHPESEFVTVRY